MFKILAALVVTVIVGYFILKNYKPQAVLFAGGIALMILASLFHTGAILEESAQTGFWFFDIFEYIKTVFASDASGTGLIIMAVGGFAIYMDKIGASNAMVSICINPLKKLNAPYLVLALSYVVGQFLNIFIPSAAGLSVLLMATLYPVLVELGEPSLRRRPDRYRRLPGPGPRFRSIQHGRPDRRLGHHGVFRYLPAARCQRCGGGDLRAALCGPEVL